MSTFGRITRKLFQFYMSSIWDEFKEILYKKANHRVRLKNIKFLYYQKQKLYYPNTCIISFLLLQAISANSPPLPPREHLAVLDAMGCVRAQLQQSEQADSTLCRAIESAGGKFITDPNMLLLKAISAASLHCLTQCLNILQRNQHQQAPQTGFVIDDDWISYVRIGTLKKKLFWSDNIVIGVFYAIVVSMLFLPLLFCFLFIIAILVGTNLDKEQYVAICLLPTVCICFIYFFLQSVNIKLWGRRAGTSYV